MVSLQNFVGNQDLIRLLRLSVAAAKERNQALPHLLLRGPAGTGKTTLAEAIATEFGVEPLILTPTSSKKPEDLRKFFLRMPGDGYDGRGKIVGKILPQVVFIDEVHQLSLQAQENLGIAMQDWRLPVHVGGKDVFEWVPRFSLVGATTLPGKLSKPFLDRFKIQAEFETYSFEEAVKIAHLHAEKQALILLPGVGEAVARRSRGVARLIVRFLDRLADAAVLSGKKDPSGKFIVSMELSDLVFQEFLKVDDRGLTRSDVKILLQLSRAEEPLGIDALAAISNEDKLTIQNTIEPYLVQEGLVARTKRGRVLTEEGRRYLIGAGYLNQSELAAGRRITGD